MFYYGPFKHILCVSVKFVHQKGVEKDFTRITFSIVYDSYIYMYMYSQYNGHIKMPLKICRLQKKIFVLCY